MGHAHAHHHHGHSHGHDHDHEDGEVHSHDEPGAARRALSVALGLTAAFMLVELGVGIWSGSLALLADAGHMLNDAAALALSLVVSWIAVRPRTARHTFGFKRAEVMGAFFNAVALGVAGVLVILEAIERVQAPPAVRGVGLLVTASLGLGVNLVCAWVLARAGKSINVRAALLHVLGDALGSVAAVTAGALLLAFGWRLADPIASFAIAVLILAGAGRLLRDTVQILMEAAPSHLDATELERTIRETPGVDDVHDLHVWALVPGEPLLSAHVVLRAGAHGTDVAQAVGERLAKAHGVHHATIQPEAPEAGLVTIRRK